ncbi:hypothetical protein OAX78_04035, partial [Planctomycetota bacterium]|nr:hypothetical protein [Planctomycetota bacterium]
MLTYCEICGTLIKQGEASQATPEGVICDGCFQSRRAIVPPDAVAMGTTESDLLQFNCCYCESLLRVKSIEARTKIKCPSCTRTFFVNPDGRVEAEMEGKTT